MMSSSSYVSFIEKKCQILLLSQHRMVHISGKRERKLRKMQQTFPGSIGHIYQEKKDIQDRKLANAHVQFCFSATFQRL